VNGGGQTQRASSCTCTTTKSEIGSVFDFEPGVSGWLAIPHCRQPGDSHIRSGTQHRGYQLYLKQFLLI
jgi:hypothetical protein